MNDSYIILPRVRPRAGIDPTKIVFSGLGYAKAAKESWTVFQKLTAKGQINPETRFQVSLPTPIAIVCTFVAENQGIIERCYETKLLSEINEIVEFIPNNKLAIQLDVCIEMGIFENVFPSWFGDTYEEQLSYAVERIVRLSNAVPNDVEFGMHLCYGKFLLLVIYINLYFKHISYRRSWAQTFFTTERYI
jgi:methionine synthase II (cobalamin-independent)